MPCLCTLAMLRRRVSEKTSIPVNHHAGSAHTTAYDHTRPPPPPKSLSRSRIHRLDEGRHCERQQERHGAERGQGRGTGAVVVAQWAGPAHFARACAIAGQAVVAPAVDAGRARRAGWAIVVHGTGAAESAGPATRAGACAVAGYAVDARAVDAGRARRAGWTKVVHGTDAAESASPATRAGACAVAGYAVHARAVDAGWACRACAAVVAALAAGAIRRARRAWEACAGAVAVGPIETRSGHAAACGAGGPKVRGRTGVA